jgi:hypothetical protein
MTRRLLRYSFNVLAALSLLLSLATVVLWVRSYRAADCIGWAYSSDNAPGFRLVGIVSTQRRRVGWWMSAVAMLEGGDWPWALKLRTR